MKKLKLISTEYENLKKKSVEKSKEYFEKHDVNDLVISAYSGVVPSYKVLEKEAEEKISEFIEYANEFSSKNRLSKKELHIKISNQILQNENPGINMYLLINLMWEAEPEKGNYCLVTIENLINNLLKPKLLSTTRGYYIESLIDIWHFDTDKLIPFEILETIILKEYKGEYSYSPFIKALSYLQDHPAKVIEMVVSKVKESKRYKEDDYYREWV